MLIVDSPPLKRSLGTRDGRRKKEAKEKEKTQEDEEAVEEKESNAS